MMTERNRHAHPQAATRRGLFALEIGLRGIQFG
jgi:hypothetical protein